MHLYHLPFIGEIDDRGALPIYYPFIASIKKYLKPRNLTKNNCFEIVEIEKETMLHFSVKMLLDRGWKRFVPF